VAHKIFDRDSALAALFWALLLAFSSPFSYAGQLPVAIRFAARVNGHPFACGQSYANIGKTQSVIKPKDFRFYVSQVRLIDSEGREAPLILKEGTKWQAADTTLIDFEDATGACINGTPEINDTVSGTVPEGHVWKKLRFTMGVPFAVNHLDLTSLPSPLNLTALEWVWNAGHKFARVEFSSTGQPSGFFVHLGSTGCTPSATKTTVPTICAQPNRVEVEIQDFDPARDTVVADLGRLLADSNVDVNTAQTPNGCMSFPGDPDCDQIFSHFGLPYGSQKLGRQDFFQKGAL
jgi:uncharacterized repeat protein (TIGR04052 family)